MLGNLIIIWTIRISLILYASVLAGYAFGASITTRRVNEEDPSDEDPSLTRRVTTAQNNKRNGVLRILWTTSCLIFIAHLVAAFHYYHHWSHQHAFVDTARQTRELLGVTFGHGIFFSYFFAALWFCDVAWWWIGKMSYERRPLWLSLCIHGYLLFIVLNGAIVFEGGVTRWVGLIVTAVLAALFMYRAIAKNRVQSSVKESHPVASVEIDEQPVA